MRVETVEMGWWRLRMGNEGDWRVRFDGEIRGWKMRVTFEGGILGGYLRVGF